MHGIDFTFYWEMTCTVVEVNNSSVIFDVLLESVINMLWKYSKNLTGWLLFKKRVTYFDSLFIGLSRDQILKNFRKNIPLTLGPYDQCFGNHEIHTCKRLSECNAITAMQLPWSTLSSMNRGAMVITIVNFKIYAFKSV